MAHKRKPKQPASGTAAAPDAHRAEAGKSSSNPKGSAAASPPPPPPPTAGRLMDTLVAKHARARLAALEGVNASVTAHRLKSGSQKRQAAMAALIQGTVRVPEQLLSTARAGGNPLYVNMADGVMAQSALAKDRRASRRRRQRKTQGPSAQVSAKAGAALVKTTKAKVARARAKRGMTAADPKKRATLTGHAASSSAAGSGSAASSPSPPPGLSLAMAARFRDVQSSRAPPTKARRDTAASGGAEKEPPRKKTRKEEGGRGAASGTIQGAATTAHRHRGQRWVRRCTSRHVRAATRRTTLPCRLHQWWPPDSEAGPGKGRRQRKHLLGRLVSMLGAAPSVRLLPFKRQRPGSSSSSNTHRLHAVRRAHKLANAGVWRLARDVVAHRRTFVGQLTVKADASRSERRAARQQRLAVARSFPLFGVVVDVLWLRFRQRRHPTTTTVRVQPPPSLLVRRTGVVLAESATQLLVLLLPRVKDRQAFKAIRTFLWPPSVRNVTTQTPDQFRSRAGDERTVAPTVEPAVVRVSKWFPGTSGTAREFRVRVGPRSPRSTSWKAVVAVVRGEGVGGPSAGKHSPNTLDCLSGRCL